MNAQPGPLHGALVRHQGIVTTSIAALSIRLVVIGQLGTSVRVAAGPKGSDELVLHRVLIEVRQAGRQHEAQVRALGVVSRGQRQHEHPEFLQGTRAR